MLSIDLYDRFPSLGYSLPFDRERDLVDTFGFLSNIGEDPNYVLALCMHEKPGTDELEVTIAVNQARRGDGLSTLEDIGDGFESNFHSPSSFAEWVSFIF